jgi:hypothetical protein
MKKGIMMDGPRRGIVVPITDLTMTYKFPIFAEHSMARVLSDELPPDATLMETDTYKRDGTAILQMEGEKEFAAFWYENP